MAKFKPNPKQLITSALIHRGRLPENNLPIIAKCRDLQDDEQAAGNAALGLVALGVVSGAVSLASLGVGPFLFMPIVSTLLGGAGYYNHPIRARRRDDEADFLRQNPQVVGLIAGKLADGHDPDVIDAALLECFTQWRSTGQRGLSALTEGYQSQTAIEVPAAPMGEARNEPPPIAPGHPQNVHGHTPIVNVPVAIHNHLAGSGNAASSATKSASPPQADRRTEAPDLSLYPDVPERLEVLLKAMAQSGFPIATLTYAPFIWCHGLSQSGKTTIAMLVSLMRIAMGQQIEYASADKVAALPWSSCAIGPMPYADKLESSSLKLLRADEDELIGWGVVFDEMLRAHKHYELDLNEFLHSILAKGSKVGATVIGISQVDTSSAHGFTGADAQWREERILIQAIHTKDAKGRRSPTGRYRVTDDGETVEWTLPEWMLTDLNSRGNPCPVQWMLNRFPELQPRTQPPPAPSTAAPAWASMGQALSDPLSRSTDSALSTVGGSRQPLKSTETLDSAYSVATDSALTQRLNSVGSQCSDEPYSVPDPATESIIRWLEKRGDDGATVGDVVAARLGPLKAMQAQDVRECLDLLVAEQVIEQAGKRYRLW